MKKTDIAHNSHQTIGPQYVDVSCQDRGYCSLQNHHPILSAPDFHQQHVQHGSRMQHQILQHVKYDKEDLQHRTQMYRTKAVPQSIRNQEVSQEKQPRPATQRHKRGIRNIIYKSKEEIASQLDNHTGRKNLLTHTIKTPHVCDACNKGFTQKNHLKRHFLIHTGEKPHECEVCHKSFTTKQNLQTHNLTHTGEKPHKCEVCHKAFISKRDLRRHNLKHTGETPHVCGVCSRGFTRKSNLMKHYFIHTGDQPYVCEICNRGFSDKSNLSKHRAIHINQKQRVCAVCCTVFSRNIRLKNLIIAQHGRKEDYCGNCNKGISQTSMLRSLNKVHSADQVGKQKNLKVLKNTKVVKDGEDQMRLDDSELKAPLQQFPEARVNDMQQIYVDKQVSLIPNESNIYDKKFPGNIGSHTQALFHTFTIIDQQLNTTLEHQPMDSIGASTMYPVAGDQNIPNSINKVNEILADLEVHLQENDFEAELVQRYIELWQQFNQIKSVTGHCEITFTENRRYHGEALTNTEKQVYNQNTQPSATINYASQIGAQDPRRMMAVDQRILAHLEHQNLKLIACQTLAKTDQL